MSDFNIKLGNATFFKLFDLAAELCLRSQEAHKPFILVDLKVSLLGSLRVGPQVLAKAISARAHPGSGRQCPLPIVYVITFFGSDDVWTSNVQNLILGGPASLA